MAPDVSPIAIKDGQTKVPEYSEGMDEEVCRPHGCFVDEP